MKMNTSESGSRTTSHVAAAAATAAATPHFTALTVPEQQMAKHVAMIASSQKFPAYLLDVFPAYSLHIYCTTSAVFLVWHSLLCGGAVQDCRR
jgi:hypothetical protein